MLHTRCVLPCRMGRVLDELNFEFFEEPLPQSPRYAGYEVLRDKLPLPLAGGEAVDSRIAAKDLIDRRAVDIIQPDAALCGGIGEALFIGELAALSGRQMHSPLLGRGHLDCCFSSVVVYAA